MLTVNHPAAAALLMLPSHISSRLTDLWKAVGWIIPSPLNSPAGNTHSIELGNYTI